MPLFDFECEKCGKATEHVVFGNEEVICECGNRMKKLFSAPSKKYDMGDNKYPYVEENICDKPIKLESSSHRKQILKQHGLEDGYKVAKGMPGQWV